MLALPLTGILEDSAMTALEDALFDVSFLADDNVPSEEHFLKTELDLSFSLDLAPAENLPQYGARPRIPTKPVMAELFLKEIIHEIITPPKIAS